jgi:hypothetical protein
VPEWPSWLVDSFLAKGGPWALVLAMASSFVWLVATGRLVTRRQHEQTVELVRGQVEDKEKLIQSLWAQINEWRTLDVARDQRFDELLEGNRTLIAALDRGTSAGGQRGRRP